jgi:hypothetical protein
MVIMEVSPLWIPMVGAVSGCLMVVAIVGIVFWFKAREKELLFHQDLRVKEMEHQRRMKELEIELEKTKARNCASQAA